MKHDVQIFQKPLIFSAKVLQNNQKSSFQGFQIWQTALRRQRAAKFIKNHGHISQKSPIWGAKIPQNTQKSSFGDLKFGRKCEAVAKLRSKTSWDLKFSIFE